MTAKPGDSSEGDPLIIRRARSERFFTTFDIYAVTFATGLKTAVLASLTPVAVSLVRQLHGTATGGVALSALPVAANTVGSAVSIAVFYYCVSPRILESKYPYYAMATFLIFGLCCYFAVFFELPPEAILGESDVGVTAGVTAGVGQANLLHNRRLEVGLGIAVGGRFTMALGEGCIYSGKRLIARLPPGARRDAFFWLNVANDAGLFGGPFLVGLLIVAQVGDDAAPLVLGLSLALAFLALITVMPMDRKWPEDDSTDNSSEAEKPLKSPSPSLDTLLTADEPPSVAISVVVQLTSFYFGLSRTFFRFAYESSIVVILAEHFGYTEGGAGILVGVMGAACLMLILVAYHAVTQWLCWDLEVHSFAAILVAGSFGIAASVLIILAAHMEESGLLFLVLSAPAFYVFNLFGAAIGSAHPFKFTLADSRLFNAEAIVAQQEAIRNPIAIALGIIFGRDVLGDEVHVAALGRLFLYGMLLQLAILAIGWDPRIWMRFLVRETMSA